jgi:hypothetical protein
MTSIMKAVEVAQTDITKGYLDRLATSALVSRTQPISSLVSQM